MIDMNGLDPGRICAANAHMLIYKIFRTDEWNELQGKGVTRGAPVALSDGYIHLSTASQLAVTLSKHFAGEENLTLLACETEQLGSDLKWEVSRGGDQFPHLYRELRMSDIAWTRAIPMHDGLHDTGVLE